MEQLKWTGNYLDQRAGAFRVFWSFGAWTLQQSGRSVLRCDSRSYAKRKAGRLAKSPARASAARKAAPKRKAALRRRSRSNRRSTLWRSMAASALACRPAASNDEPSAVQIEIRAAELEPVMSGGTGRVAWAEEDGARHHAKGMELCGSAELPGWLARELATHEEREARDAYAWAWDVTRPVAGQYEEWRSIRDGSGNILWIRDRIAEQTRYDIAASVARHADIDPVEDVMRLGVLNILNGAAAEHAAEQAKFSGQLRVERCPITRCTLAGICVESPCSSYHRDPPIDPAAKFSGQLQQVTVPVTLPTVDHRGMIRTRYPADQCPDPETCTTCGDVPADLLDLPPPTPGEAGVLAARDAEPDCRDDDDEPLTPAERAEVTRILSDVPSDEPLAMSDPGGPTKEDADGNPYCEPAGNA